MVAHFIHNLNFPARPILNFFVDYIMYLIMILQRLAIYTSMKHSLLQTLLKELMLHSLDTLSDIRIK